MNWIKRYQLFLFDLDGLLVNTEILHYKAYVKMCVLRGFTLDWSFERYSKAAHHEASGLKDQIYAELPALNRQEPDWSVLYEEKKQAFLSLLEESSVELMPGAGKLLQALKHASIPAVVVTNSAKSLTDAFQQKIPELKSIEYWLTRECYTHAKPHSECYLKAIERFSMPTDKVIGFEDSPRGYEALCGTKAKPVLICPPDSPYLADLLKKKITYYPTFESINDSNAPYNEHSDTLH
jgi:beta-phosphoglucomutase